MALISFFLNRVDYLNEYIVEYLYYDIIKNKKIIKGVWINTPLTAVSICCTLKCNQ